MSTTKSHQFHDYKQVPFVSKVPSLPKQEYKARSLPENDYYEKCNICKDQFIYTTLCKDQFICILNKYNILLY